MLRPFHGRGGRSSEVPEAASHPPGVDSDISERPRLDEIAEMIPELRPELLRTHSQHGDRRAQAMDLSVAGLPLWLRA